MVNGSHTLHFRYSWILLFIFTALIINSETKKKRRRSTRIYTSKYPLTTKICLGVDQALKARHKTCFLRPDTGPCRADIIQWYFDVRQKRCYRFFWGGCQGNGNRFQDESECVHHCALNKTTPIRVLPHFCTLSFDYGNCFGYFNRWTWDPLLKSCRQRLYSGCGGNQNNFETQDECMKNCLIPPSNTLHKSGSFTTCIPIEIPDIL